MIGEVIPVLGTQAGDEGKGKIIDFVAESCDVVVRMQGGANAGHTLDIEGRGSIDLHQIPSGIAREGVLNIMGTGMLVDPVRLGAEMQNVRSKRLEVSPTTLVISGLAHMVLPHHILQDTLRENGKGAQGSTKSGIAFAASDKARRVGVRVEEILYNPDGLADIALQGLIRVNKSRGLKDRVLRRLPKRQFRAQAQEWAKAARELQPYIGNTENIIHERLESGERILAEGAQAYWLDLDHGKYPDVTSTDTTTAGVLSGLGIGPRYIGEVIGVAKLTKSQVGGRRFVTQIDGPEVVARIRGKEGEVDAEFGTTTGRPRQVGYFDLVELKSAVRGNGLTQLAITKMDCAARFGPTMKVAFSYTLDGKTLHYAPSSAELLARCTANYVEMPTWGDISHILHFDDLPEDAKRFVEFVSEQLRIPVTMLGVGPERQQLIVKELAPKVTTNGSTSPAPKVGAQQ